jgi:hypothetical protein
MCKLVFVLLRKRMAHVMGALLLAGGLFHASPAQGGYTLTLEITDNLGHSATVTTGPFTGPGSNTFVDTGTLFPEFSSLVIAATSDQSSANSFLNKVDISGTVTSDPGDPIDLTVKLTGSGFTDPHPVADATQALSSSSLPGAFASAGLTGTLNGTTVAVQSITPPGAAGPTSKNGIFVGTTYDAVLLQQFDDIARSTATTLNNFNATSNLTWTSSAVPEPATIGLALMGVVPLGVMGLRRIRRRSVGV